MSFTHVNYVCFFSNGTFKIGISKQPDVRLSYYVREAARFGRKVVGFWTSCQRDVCHARSLEAAVKRVYADCAIRGHAETFDGSLASGHIIVRSLGLSPNEKSRQNKGIRQTYARFGKAQAATVSQRAAMVALLAAERGWM